MKPGRKTRRTLWIEFAQPPAIVPVKLFAEEHERVRAVLFFAFKIRDNARDYVSISVQKFAPGPLRVTVLQLVDQADSEFVVRSRRHGITQVANLNIGEIGN